MKLQNLVLSKENDTAILKEISLLQIMPSSWKNFVLKQKLKNGLTALETAARDGRWLIVGALLNLEPKIQVHSSINISEESKTDDYIELVDLSSDSDNLSSSNESIFAKKLARERGHHRTVQFLNLVESDSEMSPKQYTFLMLMVLQNNWSTLFLEGLKNAPRNYWPSALGNQLITAVLMRSDFKNFCSRSMKAHSLNQGAIVYWLQVRLLENTDTVLPEFLSDLLQTPSAKQQGAEYATLLDNEPVYNALSEDSKTSNENYAPPSTQNDGNHHYTLKEHTLILLARSNSNSKYTLIAQQFRDNPKAFGFLYHLYNERQEYTIVWMILTRYAKQIRFNPEHLPKEYDLQDVAEFTLLLLDTGNMTANDLYQVLLRNDNLTPLLTQAKLLDRLQWEMFKTPLLYQSNKLKPLKSKELILSKLNFLSLDRAHDRSPELQLKNTDNLFDLLNQLPNETSTFIRNLISTLNLPIRLSRQEEIKPNLNTLRSDILTLEIFPYLSTKECTILSECDRNLQRQFLAWKKGNMAITLNDILQEDKNTINETELAINYLLNNITREKFSGFNYLKFILSIENKILYIIYGVLYSISFILGVTGGALMVSAPNENESDCRHEWHDYRNNYTDDEIGYHGKYDDFYDYRNTVCDLSLSSAQKKEILIGEEMLLPSIFVVILFYVTAAILYIFKKNKLNLIFAHWVFKSPNAGDLNQKLPQLLERYRRSINFDQDNLPALKQALDTVKQIHAELCQAIEQNPKKQELNWASLWQDVKKEPYPTRQEDIIIEIEELSM